MVVQTAPSEFCVYHTERQAHFPISANFRVKGLGVGPGTILLWNSKQVTLRHGFEPCEMDRRASETGRNR